MLDHVVGWLPPDYTGGASARYRTRVLFGGLGCGGRRSYEVDRLEAEGLGDVQQVCTERSHAAVVVGVVAVAQCGRIARITRNCLCSRVPVESK